MQINNLYISASALDIVLRLQAELKKRGINYLATVKESGNNIMVCCPFHKGGLERRPSAGIQKDTGIFHCFACGETCSLEEVISYCFGYHDGGAYGLKWILQTFVTTGVENRQSIKLDMGRQRKIENPIHYIPESVLDKFRYYHPYMFRRGLTEEVIDQFDIGYDVDTNCITFPIRDETGGTLFIGRRSVATKFYNYPKDVEKPLYGIYEFYQSFYDYCLVCEGPFDMWSAWVHGKPAVALLGTESEHQLEMLRQIRCRKLILATDNDEAGYKIRARIRKHIKNKIITEYQLPDGKKDLNEMTDDDFKNLKEFF